MDDLSVSLDNIRKFCPLPNEKAKNKSLKSFEKRREAKALTASMCYKLFALNSPLHDGYKRAYRCAEYLFQDGNKITSNYCKHRCCIVCSRIKSAQMLAGYAEPLCKLLEEHDMYLVTLTCVNVSADELAGEMDRMELCHRRIYKNIKQRYKHLTLKGMRKLECTFNHKSKTFNPHYHYLMTCKETAMEFKRQWLNQNPTASPQAQDIRKANKGALYEVFKYITKHVTDGQYSAWAMDAIYQAMYQRNTFYRMGIKKYATEEIEELRSQIIDFKGDSINVWKWVMDGFNWVTADGEQFIENDLTNKAKKLIRIVEQSKDYTTNKITSNEITANYRKAFRNKTIGNIF